MKRSILLPLLPLLPLLALPLIALTGCQEKSLTPTTDTEKQAYSVGTAIGDSVKRNVDQIKAVDTNFNDDMFLQGMRDAIKDQLQLPKEELTQISTAFQKEFYEKHRAKQEADSAKNIDAGKKFLEENAKNEGVVQTESGLQYKMLVTGKGAKPAASDTVKVHYTGTLIDGTEFDSSVKRGQPAEFPLTGVIPGWTEALQLMPVGSKAKLVIPSDLAYGATARPTIPANSTLIFEVELLEIVKPAAKSATEK